MASTTIILSLTDGTKPSKAWQDQVTGAKQLALLVFVKAQTGSRKAAVASGDSTYTAPISNANRAQALALLNAA